MNTKQIHTTALFSPAKSDDFGVVAGVNVAAVKNGADAVAVTEVAIEVGIEAAVEMFSANRQQKQKGLARSQAFKEFGCGGRI